MDRQRRVRTAQATPSRFDVAPLFTAGNKRMAVALGTGFRKGVTPTVALVGPISDNDFRAAVAGNFRVCARVTPPDACRTVPSHAAEIGIGRTSRFEGPDGWSTNHWSS